MPTNSIHHNPSWQSRKSFGSVALIFKVVLLFSIALFPSSRVFAGNDFVQVNLRVDLPEVSQAHDYIESIYVGSIPPLSGLPGDFTTAWIGTYLDNGATFMQVGFMTNPYTQSVYWFVADIYASITCLHGTFHTAGQYQECLGDPGDRATVGNWQKVELVTYNQGFWIARVYDQNGIPLDVAEILYNSPPNAILYNLYAVTEEAYAVIERDPYISASFFHFHPQYMNSTGTYTDWPASTGFQPGPAVNYLQTDKLYCPKAYYALLKQNNDPRFWYAGSKLQNKGACNASPIF